MRCVQKLSALSTCVSGIISQGSQSKGIEQNNKMLNNICGMVNNIWITHCIWNCRCAPGLATSNVREELATSIDLRKIGF